MESLRYDAPDRMTPADLLAFAFGVLIAGVGAAALLGHLLRQRPKDRLLLWLGAFAVCYGVRLLLGIQPIGALALPPAPRALTVATLNYIILLPAMLFTEELYGPGWRRLLHWFTPVVAAYAVVGFVVGAATGDPGRLPDPALWLMPPALVLVAAGMVAGYRPKPFPEWRIVLAGFVTFVMFVFHEHAVEAGIVPWDVRIEPLGMLVFIGSLSYIAMARFFRNQRQLIAIDKEMEAARQIQASILPRELPTVAGVEIAARYVPLAAVAGDFYDVIRLDDDTLVMLVADVSGHGVPAALIASMVKVAFVAETARSGDPGAILQGMNGTLCGMFDRAYVTAVCVRLDPAARILSYAIAGHPSPLVVSARDLVRTLDERGMFIGMFPFATYTTATVSVDGGDRLIMYTDGVTEAPYGKTDDLFGTERLTGFAVRERRLGAGPFADALLSHVATFVGTQPLPHDDVTIVVVDVA
jgi:sigma-B regulation protein RsbU (phosphoserine phosphatase)